MNPSKWHLVSVIMFILISTGSSASSDPVHQQHELQKHQLPINQSINAQPYWEHILREFVFKTISPPPPGNNQMYKRLLNAPFYAGPFPVVSNDVPSLVLSRGDVYYLPNGHWLFCQEGCVDCEVCTQYTHPTVKWVLRRIRRYSTRGLTRHDLQLTIVPQTDGSYHMKNLWPRSYVYVTSQGEQAAYWYDKLGNHGAGAYVNMEDGISGQKEKSNNPLRYVEKDSLAERRDHGERKNDTIGEQPLERLSRVDVESTSVAPGEKGANEKKTSSKDSGMQRPGVKTFNKKGMNISSILNENEKSRLKQFVPKLILGTDQLGQKHLVHVVPADGSTNVTSINSVASNVLNLTGQSKDSYQRILRRVFDSLSSNKRSIEHFLEPLAQLRKTNRQDEEHQLEETRNGIMGLKELARLYPVLDKRIRNESLLLSRLPFTLNWKRQRRKSNEETIANNSINSTGNFNRDSNSSYSLNPETQNNINRNESVGFHSGVVVTRDYYNNSISNDSSVATNVTQNDQKYKFIPRKFQLIVGTESTTKSGVIVSPNKITQKRYDSIPTNHSIEHKGLKFR